MSYPVFIEGLGYILGTRKDEHNLDILTPKEKMLEAIKKALEETEQHKTTE